MKKLIIALLAIVLIAGITWIVCSQYEKRTGTVLGYGSVEAREIHVGSRLGGRVAVVRVHEGDVVKTHQILISLDSREIAAQSAESRAALASAKAQLQELLAGYRPELIEKARAQEKEQLEYLKKLKFGPRVEEIQAQHARMQTAYAEYTHAEKTYTRLVENLQRGAVAEQERDNAKRTLDMARERFQAEKKNYELLKAGTRSEDIEIAAARLAQVRAELKRLLAGPRKQELERAKAFVQECQARLQRSMVQLEEKDILAPTLARVEVCDLEPGDILAPGQVAVVLLKPNDLWVKIYVKARELHRVQIKQKAEVVAELSRHRDYKSWVLRQFFFSILTEPPPKKSFSGHIVHIASQAEFTPRNVQTIEERGNQVFSVKVRIHDPEGFLRPGMSVVVREVHP